MGFISSILTLTPNTITVPNWGWLGAIINFFNSGIGNAAWTMVIFTVMLKCATFPLDYFSRYKMKKNAVIMEEMKPQLEKLEKQCKGDKQLYNQRMLPVLKKEGYSLGGACLPTLITLVLFIFIFQGLNSYATYKNAYTYKELVAEYNLQISTDTSKGGQSLNPLISEDKAKIDEALIAKYDKLNPSWFWIKNPWRPDVNYSTGVLNIVARVNPIPSYEEFTHSNGKTNFGVGALTIKSEPDEYLTQLADYNSIMGAITNSKGTGNGYYILIVLAVGISFLSQYVMQKTQGAAQQGGMGGMGGMGAGTMKFMMILFPIMLGFFAFSYSAVFTLYIITNSLLSLFATLLINVIVEKNMKKLRAEKFAAIKYRR